MESENFIDEIYSDIDDSQQQYQLGSEQENSTTVEELLISCVTARLPLWDSRLPIKERSKNIREQLWLEIYIEFGSIPHYSIEFLMKKWRNLRDTYVRLQSQYTPSGSAATKKKKWAYFDMLSFLKDTVGYKPTVSNVGVLSPSVSISSPCMSPTPEFETPHTSKRKRKEVEVPRIEGAIIEALQKVNAVQEQPAINPICLRISELLEQMPQQPRTLLEINLLQLAYEGAKDYLD